MTESDRLGGRVEDSTTIDEAPLSAKIAFANPESSGVTRKLDFGSRYHVVRVIARGGMGEVYLAYDTQLSRQVALKVLLPEHLEDGWALARFRREVALASRVTHENVLRVFDLCDSGFSPYVSMAYVEGGDLRALLERQHPLGVERIVRLFKQTCAGVAAAHDKGVIHRDLKPSNILIDGHDHVLVADFGVARALEDATITATGALVGSPTYLSPEQVKGEPTDERSDVYSLGVILYEMLAGEAPFSGDTAHAIMEQRLHRKPRPVRALRPDAPRYLEKVVSRCLAVQPQRRYPTVRALTADLDARAMGRVGKSPQGMLTGAAVGVATLAVVAGLWAADEAPIRRTETSTDLATPSAASTSLATNAPSKVLVLGIENRTGDPVFDRTLDVVLQYALRRSPFIDAWGGWHARRLASELDPARPVLDDALLDKLRARDHVRVIGVRGAIASSGARLSLALTASESGSLLLSRREEVEESRVIPTLARLAVDIRRAMGEVLTDSEDPEETGLSPSLEAVSEFAIASDLSDSGKEADSLPHYERAVAIDPAFSIAHGDFAVELANLGHFGRAREEDNQALASSRRLDERGRLWLEGDAARIRGDSRHAEAAFEELLRKWPGYEYAQMNLAGVYLADGEVSRAAPIVLKLANDHPGDVVARANVTSVHLAGGDFASAVQTGEAVLRDFPNPPPYAYVDLALAYAQKGQTDDAKATLGKLANVDAAAAAYALADFALMRGKPGEAEAILQKALATRVDQDDAEGAAAKRALLAQARLLRGDRAGAATAARQAASMAESPTTLLAVALTELEAGEIKAAASVAGRIAAMSVPGARTYPTMLEAEALRVTGKAREAILLLEGVRRDNHGWLPHFLLARSYLDAGRYSDAAAEFESCIATRGRALYAYDDSSPTSRLVARALYDLGRVRESAGDPRAFDAYADFSATQSQGEAYPLLEDARRRAGRLAPVRD